MSIPNAQSWVEVQMAKPEFRAICARELARMHQEALDNRNPTLARWCMRERAKLDSTDSTGYHGEMK